MYFVVFCYHLNLRCEEIKMKLEILFGVFCCFAFFLKAKYNTNKKQKTKNKTHK